jgi:HPt (histidine-containing phosphotransfer) domain-containing protein
VAAAPPIHPGALSGLIGSGPGGAGLAARLASLYLRDTPVQVRSLRQAVNAADWAQVARLAHTMRGASGVMGATVVVELCARIEAAAMTEAGEEALRTMALLEGEVPRALQALGAVATDVPPIDPAKLAEYRRMDFEAPGLSRTLFQLFLRDAPGRVTGIEEALAGEDATALLHVTHALKGAALQLGAVPLGTLVGEMESDAKRGDLASARGRFPQAVREWDRVRLSLTRELDAEPAQVAGIA